MKARFSLSLLLLSLAATPAHAGNAWSAVAAPQAGPPEAIGSFSGGCLLGATSLPLDRFDAFLRGHGARDALTGKPVALGDSLRLPAMSATLLEIE